MRLREIMKQKGFTVERLAEELGINRVSLQQTLARDSMSTTTLRKIANILEVGVGDLFSDEVTEVHADAPTHACPHCGKPIHVTIA